MFTKLLPVLTLVIATSASAKELTSQEIKERLQLNADVYVVDSTGKRIISGPERAVSWRPHPDTGIISGDWGSDLKGTWITTEPAGGQIALRYKFEVASDGSIKATIEEYGKDNDAGVFSGLIEHKEFSLQNLEPIVWRVKNVKSVNFVVRFMLSLREVSKPISVDNLPLAGTGISVSDNAGYLWAEDVQFNGKYSGLTSHRGTLALSYIPFKGAKEMGFAEGNQITINIDKKYQINLKGTTSFLPAGVTAKIYAVYLPEKKSKGFNSLHTFDTGKEDRVLEQLKK
jgi:hypothetical protein